MIFISHWLFLKNISYLKFMNLVTILKVLTCKIGEDMHANRALLFYVIIAGATPQRLNSQTLTTLYTVVRGGWSVQCTVHCTIL